MHVHALLLALAGLPGQTAGEPAGPLLKAATAHPMKYYLSLPPGYRREEGKRWPVLLCLDGSGSYFRGMAERFGKARGDLPFLVVAPCTCSNTDPRRGAMRDKYRQWYSEDLINGAVGDARLVWDEAGLLAVLEDLVREYDAGPRAYVTAFSGGGIPAYLLIFKHPDRVAAAALQSANFFQPEYRSLPQRFSQDELRLPVHVLLGDRDPAVPMANAARLFTAPWQAFAACAGGGLAVALLAWWWTRKRWPVFAVVALTLLGIALVVGDTYCGIGAQSDTAIHLLEERGYSGVRRALIPGVGHDLAAETLLRVLRGEWEKGAR